MNQKQILILFTGAVGVTILFLLLALFFFSQSEWRGLTTGLDWKREWDVLRYQKIGGKCWFRGCQPPRAYALQEQWEVHHWRRVRTGETCRTDSEGKRRCTDNYRRDPVYETRVYYTVNDWVLGRIAKSEGKDNKHFYWPELNLNSCDPLLTPGIGIDDPMLNCEKEGVKRQWYFVSIKAFEENILPGHCEMPYALWTDTTVEQSVHGMFWTYQNLIDCESLKWS